VSVLLGSPTLQFGGAERLVVDLAGGLARRGHDVTVAAPPGPLGAELKALGVPLVELPERGRSALGAAEWVLRLAVLIRQLRPDVVHAHNVKVAVALGAAARLARGPRRPPVVATFHGVARDEYAAAARLLRAADAVACVSDDLAHGLRDAGYPARRLTVVRNAVAAPAAIEPKRGPQLVAVGRLVEQKNHERLLEAMALLLQRRPDARLTIVGDGPLRASLEASAAARGLDGAVEFTGVRPDVRRIVAHAELLVFSSDWEGLPIAALEALAEGTPVVSTPVEGMRELLDGGAGVRVDEFSPAALARAIHELLGAPERRTAMAAAGRALIAEQYAPEAMLDAYETLYGVSTGSGPAPAGR
jgi:glycosyltransferase involved in cell wall biosynthesis